MAVKMWDVCVRSKELRKSGRSSLRGKALGDVKSRVIV